MYNQGDAIDFKVKPGRGRPQMGVIIETTIDSVLVETPRGKRLTVPRAKIIGKHVSRYTERQRRLL
jgi:hypothetical protein